MERDARCVRHARFTDLSLLRRYEKERITRGNRDVIKKKQNKKKQFRLGETKKVNVARADEHMRIEKENGRGETTNLRAVLIKINEVGTITLRLGRRVGRLICCEVH